MTGKQNSKGFILVFLGMLSAFGPFVMDMYLPTLPAMSDFFQTTSSKVQLGLTTSMVGLAIGQLIFGPLSDKYGRRSPLFDSYGLVPDFYRRLYFFSKYITIRRVTFCTGNCRSRRSCDIPVYCRR